ncbi:hypothetical protein PDE_05643 [Penicillium oxalicum 114-2]|uniref:Zn(2)-C6 fungal-type domain-containing protein n=1 Tax=Penicillium oxalicum (strain 114-2 / CGMCC 5302) TaxID=933388 RepID=S7ZPX2_PENO1|nr:hypothetical protein PDE_05643 [Penicillium oxalicum 114-2]
MRRVKKSRNGCARCKSKRVKCGEEKPQCSRCIRLGVRCPGYVQSLRWVTQHEQQSPSASSDGQVASPAVLTKPCRPSLSPQNEDGPPVIESDPGSSQRPPQSEHSIDASNAMGDRLWDLSGDGLLLNLSDLCPPFPMAATSSPSPFSRDQNSNHFDLPLGTAEDMSHFLASIEPAETVTSSDGRGRGVFRDFAPSAIVRSCPSAQSQRPTMRDSATISRSLNNPSWTLIEYYFKEVAALFSSYDSQMNPFRTTVSRLWGSSLAMCRTMQSMAAATLVSDFPQFGPMGRKLRGEAVDIITQEAVMDDKSLLALLMLGQTASWHDPKDLGVSFFNLLRKHLNSLESSPESMHSGGAKRASNNFRFFKEALIYWEMLLSFVTDKESMTVLESSGSFSLDEAFVLQRIPHPWTGIARDTQFTVQEVGRLVRRERKRIRARQFTSQDEITRAQQAIQEAQELEQRLLELVHPSEAEIVSPGDEETPVWHLVTMAEVYRCTGLMQLYRVFPDLLRNRLPTTEDSSHTSMNSSILYDPFFPIDLDSVNLFPESDGHSPSTEATHPQFPSHPQYTPMPPRQRFTSPRPSHIPISSAPPSSDHLRDQWLTEFALTTLSRLKTIPIESRTRCLQPFLLVASCSELRLPKTSSSLQTTTLDPLSPSPGDDDGGESPPEIPSISMEAIKISQTRRFILGRLSSFLHVLPPKPIHVCVQLVKEVWRRMDAGQSETYWVDVMIENGWETTMG